MKKTTPQTLSLAIGLLLLCLINQAQSADKYRFEDEQLSMRISTGKPEQIAAFYNGRGFNQESINAIIKTCFVSVRIENKTYEALWLIPDDWRFYNSNGDPIRRIKRSDWKQTWTQTGLKQAHQSTFGWTQLPEIRDLRPNEPVGGNLTIAWQSRPFTLVANFRTDMDQSGEPRTLTFENLTCKEN